MEEKNHLKLCVICCAAFNSGSTVKSDSILCREHLVNFCKLLGTSPPRQSKELDALLQNSFPGMDKFFEDSGMSVCVDCHHTITVAMEKGNEAERKEEEVRKLQLQILQQMKELQKQVDDFHEEMTKVEKVIHNSDVSCLMYHMAKNPVKNEDATNGIVLIRDRILDVMADLRDFQSKQNNIHNFDLEKIYARKPDNDYDDDDDDDFIPFIPEPEIIVGTEGLLDAGIAPMFFGHTIFGNEGDYRYEATDDKRRDSDYSASDSDVCSDDSVESVYSDKQGVRVKTKSARSDADSTATGKVRKVKQATVKTNRFKLEIVERAIERQQNENPENLNSLDLLKRYELKYNESNDQLTLEKIEILVDNETRSLKCKSCGFMRRDIGKGGSLDVEWKMRVHVVSVHIGFHCPEPACGQQLPDYPQYLKHLKVSHAKQKSVPIEAHNSNITTTTSSNSTSTTKQARSSNQCQKGLIKQPQQQSQHPTSVPRKVCPICRMQFTRKDEFIKHLQSHRKRTPIVKPKREEEEEPEIVVLD